MLPLLLAALALAGGTTDSLMGPGVSSALAAHRAERIRDVRYELALDVTRPDTAAGTVRVRFRLTRPGDVVMDFRGPRLLSTRANGHAVDAAAFNGAHVRIPGRVLRVGENVIDLEFRALIAAAGASIIRYRDASDGADYLYTLLVPADANQLFPCFDQPDLKARVTLQLATPPAWTAVANGRLLGADTTNGRARFRFRQTEPISTYLIAFAAGPWATITAPSVERPITLYVRQSRRHEVEGDSIIRANAGAVRWLERYFAAPFPFQKLDMVLAPAFPFGGMEHPGAIFYSEERFVFRERPTLPQRLGRTATIYHEVAHQWFGDLVTMRWFDDLWLKEGFATYMAAKMQAQIDPASDAWKMFYLRNKPPAYAVDVTAGTTPVWQSLRNLDQAKSNYGPIVYNKAPSVLKQLDYLVGEDAFRVGVRRFLQRHAYANATWRDLLAAIGDASGRPLGRWGAQYILRPGMPVIEQRMVTEAGRIARLELVQRPARALSGAAPWPMRVQLLIAYDSAPAVRVPVELSGETTHVRAATGRPEPSFVFANAGDYGYALTLLDERSVLWLERRIGTVSDAFLRAMLWGSLWDLVREARLAPERFVALALAEMPRERDEQIVSGVLPRLTRALAVYCSDSTRDSLQAAVERTLLAGANDASRAYGIRKPFLDAFVRTARTPGALSTLDALLDSTLAAGAPLGAPTRWAIVTALLELDAPSAARRFDQETRRDSTTDGRRRAFAAGAARPDSAVKARYFERYFADSALNEDWATASLEAFNSPRAQSLTRPYLVPALDSLPWIQRNRRIFFLGSWIGAFIDGQSSEEALRAVERFLADRPSLPADLRAKVLQAVDDLERTVHIRRTFGGAATGRGA